MPQGSHPGRHIMSYRQLRVKDLPKVYTWRLEVESQPATSRTEGIDHHQARREESQRARCPGARFCGRSPGRPTFLKDF